MKLAVLKLSGYLEGQMKIGANPHLTIDVTVDETPPPCADNDTLDTRLLATMKAVEFVVGSFEVSFERPGEWLASQPPRDCPPSR